MTRQRSKTGGLMRHACYPERRSNAVRGRRVIIPAYFFRVTTSLSSLLPGSKTTLLIGKGQSISILLSTFVSSTSGCANVIVSLSVWLLPGPTGFDDQLRPSSPVLGNTIIVQRRAVRSSRDLTKGEVLTREDLCVLRPCPKGSVPPYELNTLIGSLTSRNISAGDCISGADVELSET